MTDARMDLRAAKTIPWKHPDLQATVTTDKVHIGPDPFGLGGFQVAVGSSTPTPSRQVLRYLHAARRGKTQTHLVVAIVHGGTTHLFGPDPLAQPFQLPTEQAQRQLQSVLDEPDVLAAVDRFTGFRKARDSTSVPGFTNSGLFATHHLTQNVPHRPDWAVRNKDAAALLSARGHGTSSSTRSGFRRSPPPAGQSSCPHRHHQCPARSPCYWTTASSSTVRAPASSCPRSHTGLFTVEGVEGSWRVGHGVDVEVFR